MMKTDNRVKKANASQNRVTIDEIDALQWLRKYGLSDQRNDNAVIKAHFNEIMPKINSLLTKLENGIA